MYFKRPISTPGVTTIPGFYCFILKDSRCRYGKTKYECPKVPGSRISEVTQKDTFLKKVEKMTKKKKKILKWPKRGSKKVPGRSNPILYSYGPPYLGFPHIWGSLIETGPLQEVPNMAILKKKKSSYLT